LQEIFAEVHMQTFTVLTVLFEESVVFIEIPLKRVPKPMTVLRKISW
jgi:hypothetical protein